MTQFACSLPAPDLLDRIVDIAAVAQLASRAELIPGGVRLAFADEADLHRRLDELVAAESRCCPFLALDLRSEGGELRLDVGAPG